jgi:hypothetical protein
MTTGFGPSTIGHHQVLIYTGLDHLKGILKYLESEFCVIQHKNEGGYHAKYLAPFQTEDYV